MASEKKDKAKEQYADGKGALASAFARLEECNIRFAKICGERDKQCGCPPIVGKPAKQ